MFSETTFKALFINHYQMLYHLSLNIVRDQDMAQDCVQEVFTRLWEKKHRLMIKVPVELYLKKAVINTSINHHKRTAKQVSFKVDLEYEMEEQIKKEPELFKELLARGIDSLPKKCRAIFILSRIEGLENQEISDYLEISKKTVENQLTIALKNLRTFYEQDKRLFPEKYHNINLFLLLF